MSLSLPATAISFDLYSSCPFEAVEFLGPQSDENEGAKFDDSALSGPAVVPPVYFDHFGPDGRLLARLDYFDSIAAGFPAPCIEQSPLVLVWLDV